MLSPSERMVAFHYPLAIFLLMIILYVNNCYASTQQDIGIANYEETAINVPSLGAIGLRVRFTVERNADEYTGIWLSSVGVISAFPCKQGVLTGQKNQVDCIFSLKGMQFQDYEANKICIYSPDMVRDVNQGTNTGIRMLTDVQRWSDWNPHKVDITNLLLQKMPSGS